MQQNHPTIFNQAEKQKKQLIHYQPKCRDRSAFKHFLVQQINYEDLQNNYLQRMAEHYHLLFKVILAGDTSVGKTNLVQRFSRGEPTDGKNIAPTIGVEFSTRIVQLENHKRIKTQIWDTAGQQQYRAITTAFEQQVNPADARKFANNEGIFFQETSALTGQNVDQTFMKLIEQIYKRTAERQAKKQGNNNQKNDQIGHRLSMNNRTENEKCQC